MSWVRFFFSFHGRFNRTQFWAVIATAIGPYFLLGFVRALIGFPPEILNWLLLAAMPFSLVAFVAAMVKRLHDRGMNGHWAWAYYLAPVILLRMGSNLGGFRSEGGVVFTLAGLAAFVWVIVDLGILPCEPERSGGAAPVEEDGSPTVDLAP